MTSRTEILTGSCEVESRWRRRRATKRGGCTCIARSAAMTATATKRTRRRKVSRGSRFVSNTATATIGPNSPIAPTDRIGRPEFRLQHTRVAQDRQQGPERRRRQAQRHDDAVEHETRSSGARARRPTRATKGDPPGSNGAWPRCPGASSPGRAPCRPGTSGYVSPKSDSAVTMLFGLPKLSTKGPSMMPSRISNHDLGYGQESPQPLGDDRRQHRRHADEDQRRNGACDHAP